MGVYLTNAIRNCQTMRSYPPGKEIQAMIKILSQNNVVRVPMSQSGGDV